MNLFALPLFLVLWAMIVIIAWQLFVKKDEKRDYAVFLLAFVFLLIVYLRLGLTVTHDFVSPDEEVLRGNIQSFLAANNIFDNHSSGPMFVFFVFWLSEITGFGTDALISLAGFLFPLFAALLALVLLRKFFGKIMAEKAFWLSLLSPLFVWPLLEVRPEIFGITIFFGIVVLLKRFFDTGKSRYCIAAATLAICLGIVHLFSFFLAIILLASTYLLAKIQNKKTGLFFPTIIITIFCFFLIFSLFSMIWDIHFAVKESLGLGGETNELAYTYLLQLHTVGILKISIFILIPTIILLILFTALAILAKANRDFFSKQIVRVISSRKTSKVIAILLLLASLMQFVIQWEDINYFYGNPLVFVLMQATTIIIAYFALFQANKDKQKIFENTVLASAITGLFFAITAIAALSLAIKAGFNNFAIRIIPFLFPFVAGIAVPKLETKKIAIVLLLLLFPFALIATTRDPSFIARIPFHEKIEIASNASAETFTNQFSEQLKGKDTIIQNQMTNQQIQDPYTDKIFQNKAINVGIKR